jgi:hypothetical protein
MCRDDRVSDQSELDKGNIWNAMLLMGIESLGSPMRLWKSLMCRELMCSFVVIHTMSTK